MGLDIDASIVRTRHASLVSYVYPPAAGTNEPTSPVSPVATYPPSDIPEDDSTTGSAPEFYGFVAWLATAILWVVYILWALLPDSIIRGMGITWYPNRQAVEQLLLLG
jgi:hypothetical protein